MDDDGKSHSELWEELRLLRLRLAELESCPEAEALRAVALHSLDIHGEVDAEGRYVYVSPNIERVLGIRSDDLVGTRVIDRVHPEDRERFRVGMGERMSKRTSNITHYRFRAEDGEYRTLEVAGNSHVTRGGEVRLVFVSRDVTERVAAERSRLESEERFLALTGQSGDLVLEVTPGGRVVFASPNLRRELGYGPNELAMVPPLAICHPDDRERLTAALAEGVGGRATRLELRALTAEGRTRWFDMAIRPYRNREGRRRLLLVGRGIDERRQLEEELRRSQRLEALGRLAGGVAHDFNNLLTAISGYVELLAMHPAAGDPEVSGYLAEIRVAAHRSAELTGRLLAFGRHAPGTGESVDVNERLLGIDTMLSRLIGEDVTTRFRLSGAPCHARIDPGQLDQIVVNLVLNARDALPQGGRIEVATEWVESAEGAPSVLLRVSDDGCGMDEETRDRIFEPFFTTKPIGRGTGLGLSGVYGAVKQAGGDLQVETAVGAGTTVLVFLPGVEPRKALASAREEIGADRPSSARVLLVEDDGMVREVVARLLREAGHEVWVADGPEAARAMAAEGSFDVLLADVVMPGLSGPELARELAATGSRSRVVYMSGHAARPGSAVHELSEGALFLRKPFTAKDLEARIREALRPEGVA